MVNDSKNMIEEYRTNFQNGLTTAVQAHDFMNTYIEDDSGKPFGDFMLTVSDEDFTEVLLQANGQAVLMMQEQLAYACDTGKNTWLDRMSQINSYDNLRKQAVKACNNDANKADKLLKQKYYSVAQIIYASYDEDAGDPILAPDGDLHKGITQRGKSATPNGYSPLHFFGKPNAPQNLTFADGDNGWSYNDKEGGTYFFFERGKATGQSK